MIDVLHDHDEDAQITTARMAVAASERHFVQLHHAALARIARVAFPNAAILVVDATYACGHNYSGDVDVIEIRDMKSRPLWTAQSPTPELDGLGVTWAQLLDVLHQHLAEAFDANDPTEHGWDEVSGVHPDTYALQLPPTPPSAGRIRDDEHHASASQ
jgi:hypothetical protein